MAGNGKGGRDFLDLGDWNAVCSMCGRKRKASEMVRNWQGMFRCPEHNETRHPQEYVRAVPDVQTPPWVQPPCDEFAAVCFPLDITGIADYAVADCAICEYVSPFVSGLPILVQTILTSGTQWTVPSGWNNDNNSVECVGGGGGGGPSSTLIADGGGGGGAYSKVTNITLTPGAIVTYQVGTGGSGVFDGDDTFFNGTTVGNASVSAKGGHHGVGGGAGGLGGDAAAGVGTVKYSGGNGGSPLAGTGPSGGGGGAAGPFGPGGNGGDSGSATAIGGGGGGTSYGLAGANGDLGGAGGLFGGGAGGDNSVSPFNSNGAAGTSNFCFDATHGTGGGGGGGGSVPNGKGGNGAAYGGGGGGGNASGIGPNSVGGAGIIVVTYVIEP